MKNILGWLRWSWKRFELWQKIFISAMLLQLSSLLMVEPYAHYAQGFGMAVVLGFILKWIIWDPARSSYQQYREHKNSLLTTIKQSDQ